MKNYVLIYHIAKDAKRPSKDDPLSSWHAWFETLGNNLVDSGKPITSAKAVLQNGQVEQEQDSVMGYSIIKAHSLDEAIALAKDCPLAHAPNTAVRIYETGQM